MKIGSVLNAGGTKAAAFAAGALARMGIAVVDTPTIGVTHLLLDVPAFGSGGTLRSGRKIEDILSGLPAGITVAGGKLSHPALAGYRSMDFLEDPHYLAENAAITAHCALRIAMDALPVTLQQCPVLIIGWGRIGKCLAQLLRGMGAEVTVAARKETDRAMLSALGYPSLPIGEIPRILGKCRLLFNTAPEPVLNPRQLALCPEHCVKIELASANGLEGDGILTARGLPGIYAPESSGELIAATFLRLAEGSEDIL